MLFDEKSEDVNEFNDKETKKCHCENCICKALKNILEQQRGSETRCNNSCSLQNSKKPTQSEIIPFILQTPYGNPFFTWGNIGTNHCFVTVFFKVVKVDCKKNCALLQLLKPNVSIIDPDTDCVETSKICDVDFVTVTKECVLVKLNCYTAIKCISPDFANKHH